MRALLLGVALLACSDGPTRPTAAPPDPELAAEAFLRSHVFDEPEALRERFVAAVEPADFALRLLVEDPASYRFVDLYRARSIDGRVVFTALVELDKKPHTYALWLELDAGRWRIAGWDGAPVAVDPGRPAPGGGTRVPPDLSPATFRGAPPIREVKVPTAIRLDGDAGVEPEEDPRVRVRTTPVRFDGDCPERTLNRHLRKLRGPLARCYVDATGGQRKGRVTVRVTFDRGQRPEAYVSETTLLNNDLSDCLLRLFGAFPPTVGPEQSCEIGVPVTFSPR